MRRLLLVLGVAVVAGMVAAPALAQEPTTPKKQDVFLYVDTVNGASPIGVPRRPIGCTQTNTFIRGEQVVFRIWGAVADTGDILNTENVKYAYVKVAGLPNLKLSWGPHGAAANRVWFWTTWFNVPADYPLGQATWRVVFKTETDTFGVQDFQATVVPALTPRAKAGKAKS